MSGLGPRPRRLPAAQRMRTWAALQQSQRLGDGAPPGRSQTSVHPGSPRSPVPVRGGPVLPAPAHSGPPTPRRASDKPSARDPAAVRPQSALGLALSRAPGAPLLFRGEDGRSRETKETRPGPESGVCGSRVRSGSRVGVSRRLCEPARRRPGKPAGCQRPAAPAHLPRGDTLARGDRGGGWGRRALGSP
ncbi:PREDICTED: translation initiation factor IF-2-like, partial [Chinchilla lanigera]|uniref:translation initiation factor IF-2-like n=1 Tax=Chinchilla lanigera TaxID=34839 RepID=UPI00069739ED